MSLLKQLLTSPSMSAGPAYDAFRKSHEIDGSAGGAQTDYQVKIKVWYNHNPFYDLSSKWTTITGDPTDRHGFDVAHATNIVEVNKVVDGASRKYLAYDSDFAGSEVRLYYTDDLDGAWTPYSGNPILSTVDMFRIPSVAYVDGVFHMFVATVPGPARHIRRFTSADGITFALQETVLTQGANSGALNNFIWLNPNDSKWYLYWREKNAGEWYFYARNASDIEDLDSAADVTILTLTDRRAFPTIMYRDGKYWLIMEGTDNATWKVQAWVSETSPVSGFVECHDSPILTNDEACPKIFFSPDGSKCYLFTNRTLLSWYCDAREVLSTFPEPTDNDEVNCAEKCRTDFGDIRFTSSVGAELDYWLEDKVDEDYAIFWVKVPAIPEDPASATIYLYYGKGDATTDSDFDATFPALADDFEDGVVGNVPAGWNESGDAGDSFRVADDEAYQGTKSAKLVEDGGGNNCVVKTDDLNSGYDGAVICIMYKYETAGRNTGLYYTYDEGDNVVTQASSQGTTNSWRYKDAGGWHNIPNFSAPAHATWYMLEAFLRASDLKVKFIKDRDEDSGWLNNIEGWATIDYLSFVGVRGNATDSWYDDVYMRKYVEPEPSNGAWGAEEAVVWPF